MDGDQGTLFRRQLLDLGFSLRSKPNQEEVVSLRRLGPIHGEPLERRVDMENKCWWWRNNRLPHEAVNLLHPAFLHSPCRSSPLHGSPRFPIRSH
jgi:hypothetical protein